MRESNDLDKPELIEITPQTDTREALKRLVAALQKQGIRVVPASKGSLLEK